MTNKGNKVLYVGVTVDLVGRVWQHKSKDFPNSFTAKYNVNKLVYYEAFESIRDANAREKQIKAGSRKKKVELVEKENHEWKDLAKSWYDEKAFHEK